MPERINWSLSVEVQGGPRIAERGSVAVEAYGKVQATVEKKTSAGKIVPAELEIQPTAPAGVQLLLITSDVYDPELTYCAGTKKSDPSKRTPLDAPQLFVGAGALKLLGSDITKFFFYNNLDGGKKASISIIVGRTAMTQSGEAPVEGPAEVPVEEGPP